MLTFLNDFFAVVVKCGKQELNEVAAELCEHITLFGVPQANKPSAVVACVPTAMKVRQAHTGTRMHGFFLWF